MTIPIREKIETTIKSGVNPAGVRDVLLDVVAEIESVKAAIPSVQLVHDVYGNVIQNPADVQAVLANETHARQILEERVTLLANRPAALVIATPELVSAVASSIDIRDPDPGDLTLLFDNGLV
jgi:hypothetical protein